MIGIPEKLYHFGALKTSFVYHSGVNQNPDVVPTKVGNHLKDWLPVFTGNPGFLLSQE
jgi:hypothetical protein